MSRSYTEAGLNERAQKFINENCKQIPATICPKCGEIISTVLDCDEYEFRDMFHGDGPHLREYRMKDGGIAREVIQAEPWSGGPVVFFCLEIDGKKRLQWTEKEMDVWL